MAVVAPAGVGAPIGLTGATAATRFVGGTASGAPGSGSFLVGDFVVDQSGALWVCTAAGSPGTWVQVGGSTSSEITHADLSTFTNISATTEATATTFATVTFTADGTTAYVLDAQWYSTKGTAFIAFALYLDGTDQGVVEVTSASELSGTFSHRWGRRLVPASGSRTFTLRAWVDAGTGTAGGGAGGAGVALTGFFRVTKA